MVPSACCRNRGARLHVSSSGDSGDGVSTSVPRNPVVSSLTVRKNGLPASGPSGNIEPNRHRHIRTSAVDVVCDSTGGGGGTISHRDIVSGCAREACSHSEAGAEAIGSRIGIIYEGDSAVDRAIVSSDACSIGGGGSDVSGVSFERPVVEEAVCKLGLCCG